MTTARSSPDAAAPGRRERKKANTRLGLERAAFALFAERGYEGTTLLDITEAADVAPRTFFRYFASKEEVVLGSSQEITDTLTAALQVGPADEPLLDAVVRALGEMDPERDLADDEEQRARLMMRFTIIRESAAVRAGLLDSYGALERCIADFAAQRLDLSANRDVYPQVLGAAVTAAMRIALSTWAARGGRGGAGSHFLDALDALRSGLQPPAGNQPASSWTTRPGPSSATESCAAAGTALDGP